MMGKSFSKSRSVNEGTKEVDQSRRLEVGLVNIDSHSSMTGLGWFEVLEVIGFVLMLLFVVWEAMKYCIHRSFREQVLRDLHRPSHPHQYLHGQTSDRTTDNTPQITDNRDNMRNLGWVPAPPDYLRLSVPALEMRNTRIQSLQDATGPVETVIPVSTGVAASWRGPQ